ncbi:MAG: response regulator transcription factor [Spirochaetales bacterium]|nr:response regulator transcription factor [Spirochaetales bacterium]
MEIIVLRRISVFSAIALGLALGAAIPFVRKKRGDKGFNAFYYTLVPGIVSAILELVLSNCSESSAYRPLLVDLARAARILMGPAWLSFCHVHYTLILRGRGLPLYRWWLALNAVGVLLLAGSIAWPEFEAVQKRASSLILSSTLFYAGSMAFAVLRHTKKLSLSSWAGIVCAGISMVYYPFIALSEAFGLQFSNFSTDYPLSFQVFPFYFSVICLIVAFFLWLSHKGCTKGQLVTSAEGPSAAYTPPPGLLSPREKDVYALLVQGCSASDIADRLCVSLSTIKTHTRSIYTKLDLSGRHEAMALHRGTKPGEPGTRD